MLPIMIALATIAATPVMTQSPDRVPSRPDLSRAQALKRADVLFVRFDMNHDGFVTRDEAQQMGRKLMMERAATGSDPAPGIGGHTLRFLEQRFAETQSVTKAQFEQALLAHFDSMDTNHDGVLTAAERQQGRADVEAQEVARSGATPQ